MEFLPAYSVTSSEIQRKELLLSKAQEIINKKVDELDASLRGLNLAVWENPELGYQEFKAHAANVKYISEAGPEFKVTPSAYGLETAFEAKVTYGEGGRTMGFNSEFDANPDQGHSCGHNLIDVAGVGATLALSAALAELGVPGTVKLLGTPGEEGYGGKVRLLREGAYDDMDACMMAHPEGGIDTGYDGGVGGTLAIAGFTAEFTGKAAHAGGNPWLGVNALDACISGYNAVSALRQQIKPTQRIHGIIQGSERWAQNVIPEFAKVSYAVRAPTKKEVDELIEKVMNCFRAAALSSGCQIKISTAGDYNYYELVNSMTLAGAYRDTLVKEFGLKFSMKHDSTASTDFGNVCYKCPAAHPSFQIPSPIGDSNHTFGFTASAGKPEAHAMAMKVAKSMAGVGFKFLVDDAFAIAAKEEFESWNEGAYRSKQELAKLQEASAIYKKDKETIDWFVMRDHIDKTKFCIVERYEHESSQKYHLENPYWKTFDPFVVPLLAEPMNLSRWNEFEGKYEAGAEWIQ